MRTRPSGEREAAEQVPLAGRADDDVDPAGDPFVGGLRHARRLVDDVLAGP